MAEDICPVCHRSETSLHARSGGSETREVCVSSIYSAALGCNFCSFVKDLLARDATTPKDKSSYEKAIVRVEDDGLRFRFTGQWFAALVTEIYSPDLELAYQPKLPIPIDVQPQISCDDAASIINRWMQSCEKHAECRLHNFFTTKASEIRDGGNYSAGSKKFDPSFPERLIWIGENATTAHLVRSQADRYPEYVALSYCWGGDGTFKTEQHTLKSFEDDIPLENLPLTIKDALSLTKKLGLSYLWVDAICIVQGNKQDWEKESQKMGYVYSNAKIVLSATRSANVEEGIFQLRSVPLLSKDVKDEALGGSLRARRNLNHEIIISCRTKSDRWWEKHITSTFPLLSRGWGFQERMLATRVVHFTPSELVWECQRSRKCECRVMESNLYPKMNNLGSALRICLEQTDDERSMRQMWREIVNSYSVRKLTQIEDKLPALSSIAALLQERSGDTYAAGLWKRSLPFDLLWRCDQSGILQSKKTRSPSWSWISVDGAVKWPVSQYQTEKQPLKYISSTTYFEGGSESVDDNCKVEIEVDGEDKFGRVKSGRIEIKTRIESATISHILEETWKTTYGTEWAVQARGSDLAPFWPDLNDEGWQHDNVASRLHVMEIMKPRAKSGSWEATLVVRLRYGSEFEFERVGVAANVTPTLEEWKTVNSWFHSPYSRKITLI